MVGAAGHAALPLVSAVMLEFVAPLTAVTLVVLFARHLRRRVRAP